MGLLGGRPEQTRPHPRREPRFPGPLTLEAVEGVFRDCADFTKRSLRLGAGQGWSLPCACSRAW